MKTLLVTALVCAASTWAAQPDYFPLQVGNQWTLQAASTTPEILNIEVLRSRIQNGETYFLVSGYAPQPRWLRQTSDGTMLALDEKSGEDVKISRLAPGTGGYRTSLGGCEQLGHPFAVATPHRGSSFDYEQSLTITYVPIACRDVGLQQEVYAPNIGPVRRAINSIRGEMMFDLVYASVNGLPVIGKSREIVRSYDFSHGSRGWLAGFTDYNLRTTDLRMLAELRALPEELDPHNSAFFVQSMNRSDDVFMFLKKQLSSEDGLEPNQRYRLSFQLRFSSNAPSGCFGIGGAPGDSVYLKAGASADEPVASLAETGEIRLSIDKGQQSMGGRDAGVAGTIANGTNCDGVSNPYVRVTKEYAHPYPVQTDDRSTLWLLAGTDSAYEGLTGLYFESITVRVNPAVDPADAMAVPRTGR